MTLLLYVQMSQTVDVKACLDGESNKVFFAEVSVTYYAAFSF